MTTANGSLDRRTFVKAAAVAACFRPEDAAQPDTVVELRNYLLQPGKREAFTQLFESTFIESQEALGAHILGVFRDLDAPDRFVWMRGFANLQTRLKELTDFYGGALWKAHRDEANSMIIDSDDVHLLRVSDAPLCLPKAQRAPVGATARSNAMFVIDIYAQQDEQAVTMKTASAGASGLVARFASEETPNDFPRLPVHTDRVVAFMRRFETVGSPPPILESPAPIRRHRLVPTA